MDCKKKYFKRFDKQENMFPDKVFGYSLLCEVLKRKINAVQTAVEPEHYNEPYTSDLISRDSPNHGIYVHWSFLRD